jgi:hypothetical protein
MGASVGLLVDNELSFIERTLAGRRGVPPRATTA